MPKINGTPKVRFNLLNRKEEQTYLFAFFHYRGQRLKYSSGEKVRPEFWNDEMQRLNLNRKYPEHNDINTRLNQLETTITQVYRDFDNGDLSPDQFRKELNYRLGYEARPNNQPTDIPDLFIFSEMLIAEKQAQRASTWKRLQTVLHHLQQYTDDRKRGKLNYNDIDFTFFNDFKTWLFAAPRLFSINYAAKVVSVFCQIMRDAERRGFHIKTDFRGFNIKNVKTTKIALSFAELEQLYALDLSGKPKLERVRDLFLIGAYTGLRFSDFTRIRPEHIEQSDNDTLLTINTQKTGQQVSIPLFPIPLALLKKYKFAAPTISNQKMNDYLKELGQVAGMTGKMIMTGTKGGKREDQTAEKWEKLTTHVARRSFATNFYRDGVQAIVLMKITGHTTERQFMQYIAIDGKLNAKHFADLRKKENTLKVAG